ncbi:MAG: alcohol dehydrogenase catalytic domain-containing protein [Phycisphaerales bacterium]|nr:alcohol dehydrogenase catalytic domain-containing protein [Phycisphaerales bacterium]MCB9863876.1 alcohol dehydrogenase catalytic domain-containing protein [Phycisphaerales bacterium]
MSTTTAQAAVMSAFNKPVELRDYPVPAELAPGDVLVRVTLAGVCGTDVHLHRGELKVPLPLIMGHETAGTVEATGGRVSDWLGNELNVGDMVSWTVGMPCGQCKYCRLHRLPSRCSNRKAYGVNTPCDAAPHFLGGYAQMHHLRAGTAIFKLPKDLNPEALIGAGCALVTCVHGYEKMPLRWAESVVVQGAGPVGLAAAAIASDAGARPLIVIGGPADRLERCKRFGADVVIDIDKVKDPTERKKIVLEHTNGLGADMVVECVGHPAAVSEGWELARDGGRYLVLGQYCDGGPTMLNPHLITRKELEVAGSYGSEPTHWAKAISFLQARGDRFPFHELITHRFKLDEVNTALEEVANWRTGKAVILPNG